MLTILRDRKAVERHLAKVRKYRESGTSDAAAILAEVRKSGDWAVRDFTARFDGVAITGLRVPSERLERSAAGLPVSLRASLKEAAANIRRFHELQRPTGYSLEQPDGTHVELRWRPIDRVGVYVPGGRFPLFSTVIMNVVPAQVAGVKEIAVGTPPGENGWPSDIVLATCFLLGITEVYRIGGAQAVGALAYGTESIPAVDKLTGPGNVYVTAAKQLVSAEVSIDLPAGPTELAIIADEEADPRIVAAELIAQAEHDVHAFPVLLTDSRHLAVEVNRLLPRLLKVLPSRNTAARALEENGFIFLADTLAECVTIANHLVPEHLSLMVGQPERWVTEVKAGAVFIGSATPVAWGDYWAGPNHTLPTAGRARARGLLSVQDFMVPYSVVRAAGDALRISGDQVMLMAETEGLVGHAQSIAVRRENA
jgi:histidinol dehydrogenase